MASVSSMAKPSVITLPPPPLAHALSGAVGAVIAMAILYPLDQVRSMLQVDDELARECSRPGGGGVLGALNRIVQRHGKAGLWRGMVPVLITMGVSNFVYFYCFNGMKVALLARRRLLLARRTGPTATAIKHALATRGASVLVSDGKTGGGVKGGVPGATSPALLSPIESIVASTVAGVINVLATTPLWVSNLRIKSGNAAGGLFSTLAKIGRDEGLSGLWSGAAPSLVLVSNPIIQFVVYEALKQLATTSRTKRHAKFSGISPSRAVPHLQAPPPPAIGFPPAFERGVSGGGVAGGIRPQSEIVSTVAVGLPSHEAFLLGAAAKAVSTVITYPLQLAQAKLRAGRVRRQFQQQGEEDEGDRASTSSVHNSRRSGSSGLSSIPWQVLTCWTGSAEILLRVCREKGATSMYQGIRAKLLHTVLTSALLFVGYERLVQVIANVMAKRASMATTRNASVAMGGALTAPLRPPGAKTA